MRKIAPLIVLVIASLFTATGLKAQEFNSPSDYNNYIIQQQVDITKKFLSYNSSIAQGKSARKVEKRRLSLIKEVETARDKIQTMGFYKGDRAFRDAASDFLLMYYHVLNEDYAKIVDMEEIAEQSYDNMEAYMLAQEKADEKLSEAGNRMDTAQQAFATKFNMTISKEANEKIAAMSKEVAQINNYDHKLYLIFFKPYKQEMYLTDAINRSDVNAIEQSKNSLLQFSKEGLAKLDTTKSFRGDNSLVVSCKKMFQFFIQEGNDKIPTITDFMLKKEKFDKIKEEYSNLPSSKKTKEEVDKFNNAVNDLNKGVDSYNQTNKYLNSTRTEKLNDWNSTRDKFMSTYTPRYK